MTDQHKQNALSCENGPEGMTPFIDQLASDSVQFENAYTPSPVCGPARASLKTGLFPPETGVICNWHDFKPGLHFLPQMLKDNGYETGMAGKLHFFPALADYGFQKTWLSDAPYSVYCKDDPLNSQYISWLKSNYFDAKGIDPVKIFDKDELSYDHNLKHFISGSNFRTVEEHETNWTKLCTLNFLQEREKNKPFFFYCSFFGPHQPYCPPKPYDSWIKPEKIQLPDSFYHDYKKNSDVFNINSRVTSEHIKNQLSEQDCKEVIAEYYGQIHMIDKAIGEILSYLKTEELYEDTFIIFSSDHGDHLGEHGLFFKGQMYDSCAKVPLIIKLQGKHGSRKNARIVNTIDLYQTILDLTGTENKNINTQSNSLLPLLKNSKSFWNDETYSIIGGTKQTAMTMVRTKQYKLIRHPKGNEACYELYDLISDPEENHDLWKNDKCPMQIRQELKHKLDCWSLSEISHYQQ